MDELAILTGWIIGTFLGAVISLLVLKHHDLDGRE